MSSHCLPILDHYRFLFSVLLLIVWVVIVASIVVACLFLPDFCFIEVVVRSLVVVIDCIAAITSRIVRGFVGFVAVVCNSFVSFVVFEIFRSFASFWFVFLHFLCPPFE